MKKEQRSKKEKSEKPFIPSYSACIDNFIHFSDFTDNCIVIEYPYQKKKLNAMLLKISGIDIFHFTDEDIYSVCSNFAKATNALRVEYKYVFYTKPVNLDRQKAYIQHKIMRTDHPFRKKMLEIKYSQMEAAEQNRKERLSYLILFSEEKDKLIKQSQMYITAMRDTNVEICDKTEAIRFYASYFCRTDKDAHKLSEILPDNLEIGQNYLKIDNKYSTILEIHSFPAELQDLKLTQLISRLEGIDVTIDVKSKAKRETLKELEASMDELSTRYITNTKQGEELDTQTELDKLTYIRQHIANGNEQILYLTIRLIITENSLEALADKVQNISLSLNDDGMDSFIPFNLMREEYISLARPSNPASTPFPLQDTFSKQFPFYFQSHLDNDALIFGESITGGLIALDFFHRDMKRASYDIMLAGAKGSGKSVTLKSLIQEQLLLLNKVLCIDLEGEYDDIANIFSGQIIRMNKNSLINPLQIRTVISSDDEEAGAETNFASELSRVITFFYYFIPSLSEYEADILRDLLLRTYNNKSITPTTDISLLSNSDFPTLSDLLSVLRDELYIGAREQINSNLSDRKISAMESLEISIKSLCEGTYSSMFNGFTNVDVYDNDFVVFNVKDLSTMEQRIYNAQLFNILSLMWQEVCRNVTHNRSIFSSWDRRKITCVIDEAHRFISSDNPQVTEFIETLTRRSRKYEAGILFASQSITDFNPPRTDKEGAGANKVRTIFSLVKYKMILKHSNEKFNALVESFPQFTVSELSGTSEFASGEMLISLGTGRAKFHCARQASQSDLIYIGNSEDKAAIAHSIFDSLYPNDTRETRLMQAEYLRESAENAQHFCDTFALEMMWELGGFERADSEVMYSICYDCAANIANELLSNYK